MPLSNAFIDKIKSCGVLRLAEKYTKLFKLNDNRYIGHCPNPAHHDDTASFTVLIEEDGNESWFCYGCHCGKKGENNFGSDNIAFVQWVSSFNHGRILSFPEAVQKVAEFYDVDMEEEKYSYLYQDNDSLTAAYQANITPDAIDYLHSRGINDESITEWRLGFNGERVTFPIIDRYQRVLGFSNRKFKDSTTGGKYVNSRNSKIFTKSKAFYGLQFVDFNNHELFITEGQTDAILAQQYGIKNVVASMTCHLSDAHIEFIRKHNFQPIMCYDDDEAGKAGAKKALDSLYNVGVKNVRVLMLPSGKDMADMACELKEKLPEFVKAKTMSYSQYILKGLADTMDAKIIDLQQQMLPSIQKAMSSIINDEERLLAQSYIQHRLKIWCA